MFRLSFTETYELIDAGTGWTMATEEHVVWYDDLTGEVGDDIATMKFGWNGRAYEIDLSAESRKKLEEFMQPIVSKARVTHFNRGSNGKPSRNDPQLLGHIRDWARTQGIKVSDRGRLPVNVVQAYEIGHGKAR